MSTDTPIASRNDPEVGQIIAGKYRLDRILGVGGMGIVFAATHIELDQTVALKFIRAGLAGPEAKSRFLREARAVVKLRSEHVARVLDAGTLEGGDSYMALEFLEGSDLSALAKGRGALPVEEAADYILQAVEGLAEAHAQGIVHRDLKPANIFLTRTTSGLPLIKVLDFGISKTNVLTEKGDVEDLTRTSAVLGSPRYMSPEQMRSAKDVDARADIWSLGVILYRLTAGRVPFDSDSLGAMFGMVMNDPHEPLPVAKPGVPQAFADVVDKCLQKDARNRFADLAELARALEPFAPARANGAAERVDGALRASKLPRAVPLAAGPPIPLAAASAPSETGGAWEKPAASSRRRIFVPLAGGAALLVAAAVWWTTRAPAPTSDVTSASSVSSGMATPATTPSVPAPIETAELPSRAVNLQAIATTTANVPARTARVDAGVAHAKVTAPTHSAQERPVSSPSLMDRP
ncbi:MAG: Serine/threonine protein kinase PrkC, regulator of stationary phase [Myxococcaceae bacterium]|nr:Serine/threonine protein kinase PrkC, regulator of stationary phase [Myxococcaceae bacterium]